MSNGRRRNYDDDYEYPVLRRRPDFYSPRRRCEQSTITKLLSSVGEDVLKSAVLSIALAVPAIRRLVFRLLLIAFLLGAFLMVALIYGVTNLSNSSSRNLPWTSGANK